MTRDNSLQIRGTTPMQLIETKQVTSTLLGKPVKIRQLKDAKRLLSKLITEFQKGTINGRAAKDLTYLVISFVQIAKDIDLEDRIQALEDQI